jgi:hypothetical protein
MRWKIIFAFIAFMVTCGNNVSSNAAEISCSELYTGEASEANRFSWLPKFDWGTGRMPTPYVTCIGGFLRGEISKGDYDKVTTFLKAHFPFVSRFDLEPVIN